MTSPSRTAVVSPVFRNAETLPTLVDRLHAALDPSGPWTLRLVVDACPAGSAEVALGLARADPRVRVTVLARQGGQHRALATGLAAEPDARSWVCLDADLQDPPDAVPALLERLDAQGGGVVFAGRRGRYEGRGRRLTGDLHRAALHGVTGLPRDAGAYLAMDRAARDLVVARVRAGAPSVVAAAAGAHPISSVPVGRDQRPVGRSAWTGRARLRQSVATLRWAAAARTTAR